MIITVIITVIILPLLVGEFSELAPWTARKLLSWGAHQLPTQEQSERYQEEWLAGIEDVPGKLVKLIKALSIVCYTVPLINWHANGNRYLWPVRRAADAFLSTLLPRVAEMRRTRLINSYEAYLAIPDDGRKIGTTVGHLLDALRSSSEILAAKNGAVVTAVMRENEIRVQADHREKRFVIVLGSGRKFKMRKINSFKRKYDEVSGNYYIVLR
jgi:hypothetical protein